MDLRKKAKTLLHEIGFQTIQCPRGVLGQDVVTSCKRVNTNVLELGINDFERKGGQKKADGSQVIRLRTKRPNQVAGASGCALNTILRDNSSLRGGMDTYAAMVEDDIMLATFNADQTRRIPETLMTQQTANPDAVYIYNHDAQPKRPLEVLASMPWPEEDVETSRKRVRKKRTVRLVRTKLSYSTCAFFIRREAAAKVLENLDASNGPIYSSDGAIRKACTDGRLTAAHFESDIAGVMARRNVIGQLPPAKKGGSRLVARKRTSGE